MFAPQINNIINSYSQHLFHPNLLTFLWKHEPMESLHSLTQFDESGQKVQFERIDYKGDNLLTVLIPPAFQGHVFALHEVRVDSFSK